MSKNKLFPLISILTLAILFGTAATCNFCGINLTTDTTATTTTENDSSKTVVESNEETTSETTGKEQEEETMATEEEAAATETEVIGEGSGEGVVFTPDVDKNLSGYIVKDGPVITRVVMVGDTASNKETKGYISFNISELLGSPVVSVELKISNIVAAVDPTFADQVNIKVYNYGDSLDISDFAVGGDSLVSIPTAGLTSINISSNNLKDLMNKSITAGTNYFQLKLGLSTPTDNDNTADLFAINLDNAKLTVEQ